MSKCFGAMFEEDVTDTLGVEELGEYSVSDDRWFAKFKTPEQYIEEKLKMLRYDMCIDPTEEELAHLSELTTEIAIDNAIHSIIDKYWSRW